MSRVVDAGNSCFHTSKQNVVDDKGGQYFVDIIRNDMNGISGTDSAIWTVIVAEIHYVYVKYKI